MAKEADLMETIAVLREPGGNFEPFNNDGGQVHAVLFSDGRIWDAQNGFREPGVWGNTLLKKFHAIQLERGYP